MDERRRGKRTSDQAESDSSSRRLCPGGPLTDGVFPDLIGESFFPKVSRYRRSQFIAKIFGLRHELPSCSAHNIGSFFDQMSPKYSKRLMNLPDIEVGKRMNILNVLGDSREALLSYYDSSTRDGDMPSATTMDITGKYVMIWCVFVPSIWSSKDADMVYHTALASHELARRNDFVLVVVPMMREGFTRSYYAYEKFLSAFSCLAVHLNVPGKRQRICAALKFKGEIKVLILDPSQKVLYHGPPNMFQRFGGGERDCFPFTPEKQADFLRLDSNLDNRPLDELLGLGDRDVLYSIKCYRDGSCANGRLKRGCLHTTVSELKGKTVGLYVCSDGRSLNRLEEVHNECRRRESEFEVVVVCCPFWDQVPPKMEEKLVCEALVRRGLLNWWMLPFNNTVSHRLQRMCEKDSGEEGLFVVDPRVGRCVDPYGFPIIVRFGMDKYPFTRRCLVEREFERVMKLRLSSLLSPWTHVHSSTKESIPVAAKLEGKMVVLYMYKGKEETEESKKLAGLLGTWYTNYIKGKASNVEVVAVCIDGDEGSSSSSSSREKGFMDMGWLVCGADPTKSAKLCEDFFRPYFIAKETVVAFGEHGEIQYIGNSEIFKGPAPPSPPQRDKLIRKSLRTKFYDSGFTYMRGFGAN